MLWKCFLSLMIGCVLSAHSQTSVPVPINTDVRYPPIARAAHVSGDVEVRFRLEPDGSTSNIQEVSGPLMLSHALASFIASWRFQTPLPLNADRNWTANFRFGLRGEQEEDLEDQVDGPPAYPCCGDVITLSAEASQIQGILRSDGASQTIDWKPQEAKPVDNCPGSRNRNTPSQTGADDFIEIQRRGEYTVRLFRGGRIEWDGIANVESLGVRQFTIDGSTADHLFERFAQQEFWSACSVILPPELGDDGERIWGSFLTAQINGQQKSVQLGMFPKYAWAVDSVINTHMWRHGDPMQELPRNMQEDIREPKPGVTALIRATNHFNSYTGRWTDAALKYQLARNADVEAVDASGWTALSYAAGLNNCCDDNAVQLLLNAGANPNHSSLRGDTPLLLAAYSGYLNRNLLAAGANINAQNADGVSVLMFLAQKQNADELREAIKAGADGTLRDRQGRTALDYLREASCKHAIVPLPVPWLQIDISGPPPCPARTDDFRESERVLLDALAAQPKNKKENGR